MKIITFYSDTHKTIYDFFTESYDKYLSENHTLISKKIDQISQSGEYNSNGFGETMVVKLDIIIENLDTSDDNLMVYSDSDVQFFGDIKVELGEYDILFIHDYDNHFQYAWLPGEPYKIGKYPNYCAGFFICKQSEKVKKFFEYIRETLLYYISIGKNTHDQIVMNKIINDGYDINHGILDSQKYWTAAFSTNGQPWDYQDIIVPKSILVHHANFTYGVERKIALMNLVRNRYYKQ
jgi:hypothetical protein